MKPRYDFRCDECGQVVEVQGREHKAYVENREAVCHNGEGDPGTLEGERCGGTSWTRIYHAPAVHFRADGFYSTRDDLDGSLQAGRRAKRAKAREQNQAPPEGERYG